MSEFISVKDAPPPDNEEIEVVTIRRMYRFCGEWKIKESEYCTRVICRESWLGHPFTHWRRIEEVPADAVVLE